MQKANRMERFSDQTCLLLIRSLDISAGSEEAHQQKRQNDQGQKENAEKTVKIEINKNSTNLQGTTDNNILLKQLIPTEAAVC